MNEKSKGEIIIYRAEDGETTLEVSLKEDTVWLDAHQMADLFQRDRTVIVRHIRNIYKTGELLFDSTCARIAQVAKDGNKRIAAFLFVWFLDANGILYATEDRGGVYTLDTNGSRLESGTVGRKEL